MNNNDLKKFLDDKSWDDNKKTIEQMMEKELEKAPEEINMKFVDACMDYLTGYNVDETSKKNNTIGKKHIKFNRYLAVAIILVVSISAGLNAYAKVNNISISDMFVGMFSDHATINYSDKYTATASNNIDYKSTKLYKELKNGGIKNISLPSYLYSAKCKKYSWNKDFTANSVGFIADTGNQKFSVSVVTYTDKKWVVNPDIMGPFTASKKINVNSTDIYLFEMDGDNPNKVNTSISYQIGLTQYFISCDYSIDEAEQFVKQMN